MKHLKKILSVVLIVAMAFATVCTTSVQPVFAAGKVSSIKVKKAKKKMTMTVGQKKTFTVKVKAKKKYSKFTVKSSKKKIVKVTKKGKKITLKALKAGKAKVTVKAKSNKKKKYVMTITVKKATNPSQPEVKLAMSAESVNNKIFILHFNKAVDLKLGSVLAESRDAADADFKNQEKIKKITTEDKKDYSVVLDATEKHDFYRFTLTDGSKLSAVCAVKESDNYYSDYTLSGVVGQKVDIEYNFDDSYGPYELKSSSELPEGLAQSFSRDGYLNIVGTPKKSGKTIVEYKIEDRYGKVRKYKILIVVGTETKLEVVADDVTDHGYPTENMYVSGEFPICVAGGSGSYKYTIIKNTLDAFSVDTYEDDEDYYTSVEYEVSKLGTYTATVVIEDRANSDVTAKVDIKLVVESFIKISGTVKTSKGAPICGAQVVAVPFDESKDYTSGTSGVDGTYDTYVESGKCNIYVTYLGMEEIIPNKNVTKDTKVDIVLDGLYEVDIKKVEELPNGYGEWCSRTYYEDEYEDDEVGTGEKLYLPKGEYTLVSQGKTIDGDYFCDYECTISVNVIGDCEVTPSVDVEGKPIHTLSEGENTLAEIDDGGSIVYKFTAPANGTYAFESFYDTEKWDPWCDIYNNNLEVVAYSDDYSVENYNFRLGVYLEKGEVCYLNIGGYGDDSSNGKLVVARAVN